MANGSRLGPIVIGQVGGDRCGCGSPEIQVYVTAASRPVCKKCWLKLARSSKEW